MLNYTLKSFQQLSLDQLYAIMYLRQEVFVVEQDCPYIDADGRDQDSMHLCGFDEDNKLSSYTRLVPEGISYKDHCSIGRVIISEHVRGRQLGKDLMNRSVASCQKLWPGISIKISAQTYLLKFYSELGFKAVGEEYLEDDIPHIAMVYSESMG